MSRKRYFRPTKLSENEEQVIVLRSEGMAGKEIAELLGMALGTVWAHQHHAIRKLHVRTVRGAMGKIKVERFRRFHNM